MKNIGFIITGRMKSTRLEKKLTLKINDREVIAHMIDRAKLIFEKSNIIIATSSNPQDDILEDIAKRENISIFRGHEDDVIVRLHNAAKENNIDFFINITADCPLFGFDYIEKIYQLHLDTNADLVTSLDLPHGYFTYGLKTKAIDKILEIKKTDNTEVWGDYFYNNPDLFRVEKLKVEKTEIRENFRLTLDYPEDFKFFETIFKHFGSETYKISSEDLTKYLDKNPEVVAINSDCKNLYTKRWESQRVSNLEKE